MSLQVAQVGSREYLSSCPAEILLKIFKLVTPTSKRHVAFSRTLLPYTRAIFYSSFDVLSQARLVLLCRTLKSNPALGALIRSLSVHVLESTPKTPKPPDSTFCTILSTITVSSRSKSQETTRLAGLVLAEEGGKVALPALEHVPFEEIFSEYDKPFDAQLYRHIGAYPALRHLAIQAKHPTRSAAMGKSIFPQGGVQVKSLTSLNLVRLLEAEDLEALLAFPCVVSLTLGGTSREDRVGGQALEAVLGATKRLQSLKFVEHTFLDPSLIFLRGLALKTLTFYDIALVDGGGLLAYLSALVEGDRPDKVESEVRHWNSHPNRRPETLWTRTIPIWPACFSFSDACKLVRWRRKNGVPFGERSDVLDGLMKAMGR